MKDLETGHERRLTVDPGLQDMPLIAGNASRIAFQSRESGTPVLYSVNTIPHAISGPAEKFCSNGCGNLSDLSNDGTLALTYDADLTKKQSSVSAIDLRSGTRSLLARSDSSYVVDPRLSIDGRWVAFHESVGLVRQIFIVPFRVAAPVPRSEWIPITDGAAVDRFPIFSPDGSLLYYISERDGFRCIAARRLDPGTKRPSGSMFYIHHFHGSQRSMMNFENPNWSRLSVAHDRLVFSVADRTGNIWMMQLTDVN